MSKLKNIEYYLLLFIANAVAMLIELIIARILSPFFGSNNLVWTIIIGFMLLANALGNFIGGKMSDKYSIYKSKTSILLVSSISLSVIAIINRYLLSHELHDERLAVSILFISMIPNIAIGALSPLINKATIDEAADMGQKSGFLYTVITLGSLCGTFLGGLILIPKLGSSTILFGMSVLMILTAICSLFSGFKENKRAGIIMLIANIVLFGGTCFFLFNQKAIKDDIIIADTNDGYVRIYDDVYDGSPVRMFEISGGFSSAAFKDPTKRDELVFPYTKYYNLVFDKKEDVKDICMIGGAGYSYPRYIVSHYPDKNIDVIEIDGGITEAAKKYFYLQDFINEYGTDRLGLITGDGRQVLAKTDKKYDVVANDAFSGNAIVKVLATKEAAQVIKSSLKENGVYVMNIYGDINSPKIRFLSSEIKTIRACFKHVWIMQVPNTCNVMIFASDYDYNFDTEKLPLDDTATILTDDYCPVDYVIY